MMRFSEYEPPDDGLCEYCGRMTRDLMLFGSMLVCFGCYRDLEEEEKEQTQAYWDEEHRERERDLGW